MPPVMVTIITMHSMTPPVMRSHAGVLNGEVTVVCTGEAIGIALGAPKAAIEPVEAIATIHQSLMQGFMLRRPSFLRAPPEPPPGMRPHSNAHLFHEFQLAHDRRMLHGLADVP